MVEYSDSGIQNMLAIASLSGLKRSRNGENVRDENKYSHTLRG